MQAHATGSRRFGFNRIAFLALAIGILAIVATMLVLGEVVDLPYVSESQATSTSASPAMTRQDHIRFLEQNIWDVVPAEPTAVHPDTYPDDYVD